MEQRRPDIFFWTWSAQRAASRVSITGSEACHFITEDGHRVFDAISTNFQAAFGHSCAPVKDAIHRQLDAMPVANPKHAFELKQRVTQKLVDFVAAGPGRVFYALSGAEAVENALKMARQVSGRKLVAAREKSYHGATMGAMSVTGDWRGQGHFGAQDATIRIPEPADDPDLMKTREILRAAGTENIAAMCLETISGMNGVIIPDPAWWRGIEAMCREYGILLVVDEVSCGFGRAGTDLAMHQYGIRPDFVCMAKAISAGYVPFGALWVREDVARFYDDRILSAGLTAYAHPMGLAATSAVLDLLRDEAFCRARDAVADHFAAGTVKLRTHPRVKSLRVKGLMAAIDLEPGPKVTWEDGVALGIHLAIKSDATGSSSIILAPPFVMTVADCDMMFDAISRILDGGAVP
ncbi:aspartate aminotransferase family protein [bacterium]|nr:aspartate aminotransferase family protein [bacterium]